VICGEAVLDAAEVGRRHLRVVVEEHDDVAIRKAAQVPAARVASARGSKILGVRDDREVPEARACRLDGTVGGRVVEDYGHEIRVIGALDRRERLDELRALVEAQDDYADHVTKSTLPAAREGCAAVCFPL
jgi:hypothetical protein